MEYNCPKCGFQISEGALECLNCGIVFEKYKKSQQRPKIQRKPEDHPPKNDPRKIKRSKPEYILISIVVIFALIGIVSVISQITAEDIIVFYMALALFSSIPVFFLPSIVSIIRGHPHQIPILILNIFLGLTMVGWVVALIWSAMPIEKSDEQQ